MHLWMVFLIGMNFNLVFFLVHLLEFSWYAPLIGTLRGNAGEIDFPNISDRDINASLCEFPSVTSGKLGDGLCSSWIKYCAAWIVVSLEDIFGMSILCRKTLLYLILVPLLFWGCMTYGICSVLWMVQCTRNIIHVVIMMIYCLAYYGLLLLFLVGIAVFSCSQIIQICACRLIGGDELLIWWAYLDWLFPGVVIRPTFLGRSIYLLCTAPLWNGFWTSGTISLNYPPLWLLGGTKWYLKSMVVI